MLYTKNILYIIFSLFSMICFSQEYHFDYLIKVKSILIKPESKQSISEFFYTADTNNEMYFSKRNNKTFAFFYESQKNISHVFEVKNLENKFIFTYKYSNQFPAKKHLKSDKENIIKVEKIDSLRFKILVLKNSKSKRVIISGTAIMEKFDNNYINFAGEYSRKNEINEKLRSFLDPKLKYVLRSQQTKIHSSGYIYEKKLQKIESINLTIKLPEKLVLKEYNRSTDFEE